VQRCAEMCIGAEGLRFSTVECAGDVQVQSRWCKGAEVQQMRRGSAGEVVVQRCICRGAEVQRFRGSAQLIVQVQSAERFCRGT
jgi:hypothetical protein